MCTKTLLLSIRPKYAEKIFDGSKSVELRKVRPSIKPGDTVYVYVSSPVKELKGTFTVTHITEGPIEHIWNHVRYDAGVTRAEFDEYYQESTTGYAIHLKAPFRTANPLKLADLRRLWNGFHPPQGYKYLDQSEISLISGFA